VPRIARLINSFNGGEVSPEFYGRVDQDKYGTSVKRMKNFIAHPEGGMHRRPGTLFVKEVRDSTKKSKLVPFVFSTVQAYMLEFSEGKIRVFADDARLNIVTQPTILDPSVDTFGAPEFVFTDHSYLHNLGPFQLTTTGGLPAPLSVATDYWIVLPTTTVFVDADVDVATEIITAPSAHDYVTGQGPFRFTTTGALPQGISGNLDYYVEVVSATEFKLRLTPGGASILLGPALRLGTHTMAPTRDYLRDRFRLTGSDGGAPITLTTAGTGFHTFTPNSEIVLEINTPYLESELFDLHFVQSADFLFIDHKAHPPAQLTRRGNTKWSFDFSNQFDGPYLAENTDEDSKIAASASAFPNTDITLTLSGTITVNDGAGWLSTDIGRLVRMKVGAGNWGHVQITGVHEVAGTNTIARGTVRSVLAGTGATATWRLGSWYPGNYPASLSFADQRLWHAGEPGSPQTLHGSETAMFTDFSPTEEDGVVLDTNAVNFQIGANQVNAMVWLGTERQLFAGTPASVYVARASLQDEAITPTNVNLPQITAVGSSSVQPVNISNNLVYMTRNNQSLRGIEFTGDASSFVSVDITLLAKHIFGRTETVTTMAFQLDRQQILWLTRSDGVLVAVTYVPEQKVFAWHRHIVGGNFGGGDAVVESVAVIPSTNGAYDKLWMIVKRTISGATVRHIESMEDEWLDGVSTNMRYVDSAPAAYSGAPISVVTGLGHLEGEVVQVLADGATHPDRTVVGGSITLDAAYSDVVVGLGYVSEMETLSLDVPDPEGSSMGKMARIDHLSLRFYESLGGEIGSSVDALDPIVFRSSGDAMDTAVPPFTGDLKIPFRGGFVREKVIVVRQSQPLPMNLLAINALMSTGAR